jgi:hypothetical protein
MRRLIFWSASLGLAFALSTSSAALAQPAGDKAPGDKADKAPGDKADKAAGDKSDDTKANPIDVQDEPIDHKKPETADEPAKDDDAKPKKQFGEGDSPLDDLDKDAGKKKDSGTAWFLGARFRDFIVPHFFFSLFASGGPSDVNIFSGGPEATMRTGNLEIDMSFTVPYADYSMNEFVFKNKNEPNQAYEIISSSLKLFTFSVDLLGNIPLDKARRFSILIGGGVGISGVSGSLYRNQAYPKDFGKPDPDHASSWTKCKMADDPAGVDPSAKVQYCDSSNNHYGKYSEPSWANGGSLPMVFPYLALPHLAFRVEPVKYFQMRADTGFAFSGGFYFGFAAGGRLPI